MKTFEIFANHLNHTAQNMGGQVVAAHPGTDQKTAQTHNAVKLRPALSVAPTNPTVTRLETPRTRRKPHATQPAVRRANQITQLSSDKRTRAARMLPRHQRVPDQALLVALDTHQ